MKKVIILTMVTMILFSGCGQGVTKSNPTTGINATIPTAQPSSAEQYILKYGEVGQFGKNVDYDGQRYINYYMPAGKYSVEFMDESTAEIGSVMVDENKTYKNSSGYTEDKTVSQINFNKNTDMSPKEITVSKDDHIFITVNGVFKLTKLK